MTPDRRERERESRRCNLSKYLRWKIIIIILYFVVLKYCIAEIMSKSDIQYAVDETPYTHAQSCTFAYYVFFFLSVVSH